jgi:hypothetical protein
LSFLKKQYFCSQCGAKVSNLEELLFVEENSTKGFCSENCIESFYRPVVEYLEQREKSVRQEFKLTEEKVLPLLENSEIIESTLLDFDEKWEMSNDLGERIYTLISQFNDHQYGTFYSVAICQFFEDGPSFVYLVTATQSEVLLNFMRSGRRVDGENSSSTEDKATEEHPEEGMGTVEVDEEVMTMVENKKSRFLAELLDKRSESDIDYERFPEYDNFLNKTMEEPDEIYSYEDTDGDVIYRYVKANEHNGQSFYYFVICMPYRGQGLSPDVEALLPIMAFPSIDGELIRELKTGELLSGSMKN